MKIFYSWQSDLPNNTNRGFIRRALEDAVKELANDLNISDAERPPEVDEATKNTKGMVNISEAILRKIAECQIYVADLTPVMHTKAEKALPNPNVMYETGWASNKPGYDFIIGVMNTHGNRGPDALPFDLRGRRVLTYKLEPDADENFRRETRKQLSKDFLGAIRDNLEGVGERTSAENPIKPSPADQGDASLWGIGSNSRLSVPDTFGKPKDVRIKVGPRAYARVVPSSWPKGAPDAIEIGDHPKKVEPSSIGYSSGSFGTCELGYTRYWFEPLQSGDHLTGSITLYLEDFGEYWGISDGPVPERNIGRIVSLPHVFDFWRWFVNQTNELFDELGASRMRLLEIGIVGIQDAFLADTGSPFHRPQSRKSQVIVRRQAPAWDDARVQSLLRDGYNGLLSAFSQPKISDENFGKLLSR